MWYIGIFSFKQWPCMCFIFRSSAACLRSSGKEQPKWVIHVGFVHFLPEHEDPMGPAEGSWWEVREVRAWWGKKAIWSPLLVLPVQDWYTALTVDIHLQVILMQAFLLPSQHPWYLEIPSFLPLDGPEIFCNFREETYRDQLTSAPSLQIQQLTNISVEKPPAAASAQRWCFVQSSGLWSSLKVTLLQSAFLCFLPVKVAVFTWYTAHLTPFWLVLTLATIAAACAPLWLVAEH